MPYAKIPKALRELRAFAAPMDLSLPELTPTALPRTKPEPEPCVGDGPSLLAWCEQEGIRPSPVLAHALWWAVRKWYKGHKLRAALHDLDAVVAFHHARMVGVSTNCPGDMRLALSIHVMWESDGWAYFSQACAETQRIVRRIKQAEARQAGKGRG